MENENQPDQGAAAPVDNLNDEIAAMAAELDQDSQPDQAQVIQVNQQTEKNKKELSQALQMAIGPLFQVFAPAWNIEPEEVEALSDAYSEVLEKYFPGGLDKFGVEFNAFLITAVVFGPRMKLPRKPERPPQADKEAEADQEKDAA